MWGLDFTCRQSGSQVPTLNHYTKLCYKTIFCDLKIHRTLVYNVRNKLLKTYHISGKTEALRRNHGSQGH